MSRRDYFSDEDKLKKISVIFSIALVLTIIVFVLIFNVYSQKLKEEAEQSLLELGSVNAVVPNINNVEANPVSSMNDKNINEVKKETTKNKEQDNKATKKSSNEIVENANLAENNQNELNEQNLSNSEESSNEEKELIFLAPVNGEILKDFASDSLIYSKTLDEWTIHTGIDIKADKTTIVTASEAGVVESVKSDPRYGLTVTLTHANGFKTVYANLLTAEFVKEGEIVEKGQTLGTVGESASFEVAEETHLHFEMIKDGEYVNPTLYLK